MRGYQARKSYKQRLMKKLIRENEEMYRAEKQQIALDIKAR